MQSFARQTRFLVITARLQLVQAFNSRWNIESLTKKKPQKIQ
jgi:hypothetical protein